MDSISLFNWGKITNLTTWFFCLVQNREGKKSCCCDWVDSSKPEHCPTLAHLHYERTLWIYLTYAKLHMLSLKAVRTYTCTYEHFMYGISRALIYMHRHIQPVHTFISAYALHSHTRMPYACSMHAHKCRIRARTHMRMYYMLTHIQLAWLN